MRLRNVYLLVFLILLIDQSLKLWIKTHLYISQEFNVLGNWFKIHFIENEGMAYGLQLGGEWGKVALTLFRLVAVVAGFFLMKKLVKEKYHRGLIICGALILAGALGNLIDSLFYGLIFSDSTYYNVAKLFPKEGGYAGLLHGKVVDMLYFPIYEGFLPKWIPFKGGDYFIFFRPVFNVADASISIGVITILLFQKRLFRKHTPSTYHPPVESHATVGDEQPIR